MKRTDNRTHSLNIDATAADIWARREWLPNGSVFSKPDNWASFACRVVLGILIVWALYEKFDNPGVAILLFAFGAVELTIAAKRILQARGEERSRVTKRLEENQKIAAAAKKN